MWSSIRLSGLAIVLILPQGCGGNTGDFVRIVAESAADSATTFKNEYGPGSASTLARGTQGIVTVEPYRQGINNLHDDGKISSAERDARLSTLFAAYDAYRDGRMSRSDFEQRAGTLMTQ